MTPNEFVEKYIGKEYAETPQLGAQCVYAYKLFCDWIGIGMYPTGTGWANGYWELRWTQPLSYNNFEFIDDPGALQEGDWLFWDFNSSCPYSHVAMFLGYTRDGYGNIFSQNQSSFRGFTVVENRLDILGGFRWKGWKKQEMSAFGTASVTVNNLNIRANPSLSAEVVGRANTGDTFDVHGIVQADGYVWLQIASGWIACGTGWVDYDLFSDNKEKIRELEDKIDWYLETIGKTAQLLEEALKTLRGE